LGSSGTSGTSGQDGTLFGSSGTSGQDGTNATGVAGTSGTSGTTPPGFTSGTSGETGTSGTSGTTPPGFTSGTSGSSGESGTAGTSGTTPPGFTSGTSGTSGISGTAGTSGTTPPGFTSGTSGQSGTSGTSAPGFTSGTSGTSGFPLSGNTEDGILTYNAVAFGANVESNLTFNGTTLAVNNGNADGNIEARFGYILTRRYIEVGSDLGTGGSVTLDLTTANNFRRQFNGNATITFTNPPAAGFAFGFTLVTVNAGAYTITWPSYIDWAGGSAPTLTSVGTDILVFYTYDGGTTFYGFVSGKNFS
jgi:hypothetical protein